MFSRMPSVRIDRIEKIEITIPFPFIGEDLISDSAKLRLRSRLHTSWPIPQSLQLPSEEEKVDSTLLKTLDYVSKGVSILSGIAVIVFVGLLWSGQTTIGSVQIGTLLTIFSFTLVSGLISIGGVKMFSINANLRKAQDRIERVITMAKECPFLVIFAGKPTDLRRPGNPYFCKKCPLAIDIDSSEEGKLKHLCSVYPTLHRQWRQLPGAEMVLRPEKHL